MKRNIQRILVHCSTILFVACLAMPCMAVQDVPLPDSNTQKTEPPVVTPVQAEPVRASNMLLPIEGQVTTAKLIVIKPKQATSNPPADASKNPPTNPTTSRATISQLPSDRQAQVTNVKILGFPNPLLFFVRWPMKMACHSPQSSEAVSVALSILMVVVDWPTRL